MTRLIIFAVTVAILAAALDLSPTIIKPQQCKKNEIWTTCASKCPAKCGEPVPITCTRDCDGIRCECKKGFFLNRQGECVTRAECDAPKCKKNQIFNTCPELCPQAKCGDPEPRLCTKLGGCGDPKCECKKGFFLNNQGECVTRAECNAPKCKKNEIFNTCPELCNQAKCGDPEPRICTKLGGCGDPKCECKKGFYLNNEGECVTRAECDAPKCKKNEIFNTCPELCPQAKCGDPEPRICSKLGGCGDPKCECKKGFYLNNEGECVTRAECDAKKCKKNEIFNTCPELCPQAKCGEYGQKICVKIGGCDEPKCECKNGFYLNNEGECVTRAECDQDRIVFPDDDRIIFPE